jgi:hypothetical protein
LSDRIREALLVAAAISNASPKDRSVHVNFGVTLSDVDGKVIIYGAGVPPAMRWTVFDENNNKHSYVGHPDLDPVEETDGS